MRISFEFSITIGDTEPAHIEDHTGYIADAGTPVGFERTDDDG